MNTRLNSVRSGHIDETRIYSWLIGLAAALLTAASAEATIRTVGASGCSNTTIAAAVSAAADGDTIRITDSVITESGILVNPVNKSLTIEGLGLGTIVQGAASRNSAASRIFRINLSKDYTLTLRNMTLRYGVADASGGGAVWLEYGIVTVTNCVITMNDSVGPGGGIYSPDQKGNGRTNYLYVFNSEISSNTTSGAAGDGGGIGLTGSSLDLDGCAIYQNTAARHGGGLNHAGGNSIRSQTRNCTFFRNTAASGRQGGAINYSAASTGGVFNCTVYSNSFSGSPSYGGGIAVAGSILSISSSIVASNYNGGSSIADLYGASMLLITNCLLSQSSGWPVLLGNVNNKTNNPRLGAFGSNGGPTPTFPLLAGSPCLDAGLDALGLSSDQRGTGYTRSWGSGCDIGAYEYGAGVALSYSATNFNESMPANAGAIDNTTPLLISLTNDTFTGADGDQLTNQVAASNIPAGLTLSMIRTNSGTGLQVKLLGNAATHTVASSIANMGFAFADGAFTLGHAAQVANASRSDLSVTFFDPVAGGGLIYSGTNFTENATYNDGRLDAVPISITVTGDQFNASVNEVMNPGKVQISNLPAGLSATVTCVNSTNASLLLTGQATSHAAANSIATLGLAFQDSAFLIGGNAAAITGANRSDLSIAFLDPATGVALQFDGSVFNEGTANDGSISNTLSITLTNDIFEGANGDNFVTAGRVVATGVPAGLTAVVQRVDMTHLTASLTGRATAHNSANNTATLGLTFQNNAFHSTLAASVAQASRSDLQVAYINPLLTYSSSTFTEFWQNDGSIGNTLTLTLTGDTFAGANSEDYIVTARALASNVPGGLSASLIQQSASQVVYRLNGTATSHATANSITTLGLAFQNSAFTSGGAAAVSNGTRSNLAVTFAGTTTSSNYWVSIDTGSDTTGNGSVGNPWKTIKYALTQTAVRNDAYDTLHVLAGTYNETNITVAKIVTIEGAGRDATIVQAGAAPDTAPFDSRVFNLNSSVTLRGLTIQHGHVTNGILGSGVMCGDGTMIVEGCRITKNTSYGANVYNGGAIAKNGVGSLTLISSEILDNTAHLGGVGGVYCGNAGSLTVSNCVVSGNRSAHRGGGLYNYGTPLVIQDSVITNNTTTLAGESGGGLFSEAYQGTALIERTLWANNSSPSDGGGIYQRGTATVVNCTFYGNASLTANGGGLLVRDGATTIYNSTFTGNTASNGVGGGLHNLYGTFRAYSSIVAGNYATNGMDLSGVVTVADHCFVGNNTGSGLTVGQPNASSSYVGSGASPLDPLLNPLANNGGGIPTCALQQGSPCIDRGSNPLSLATDQRGTTHARIQGGSTDIGAFEATPPGSVFLLR